MLGMTTTQVQSRWADTRELDDLVVSLTLASPGNPPRRCSRADVIHAAVDKLYQERRPLIEAEQATWRGLLERAGGPETLLTLTLTGRGEPEPEKVEEAGYGRFITPARWVDYEIAASVSFIPDGRPGTPLPLPLHTEHDEHGSQVAVSLTDASGEVRIPLGAVSRNVDDSGYYDVRLGSIADDLGLPT